MRRASHLVGLVLVALALVVLVVVGVAPAFGRYRVMTVLSASMRPSMAEGSLVFTTPTPTREVRVGDVITYQAPSDGRVVTHRVVEVIEPGERPVIRTKGDAMTQPDPWLARLDGGTAWRMRAAVPFAGYAVNALRKGPVRQATTVVLPMFALASALAAIWRRQDDLGHTIPVDPAQLPHARRSTPRPSPALLVAVTAGVLLAGMLVDARRGRRRAS